MIAARASRLQLSRCVASRTSRCFTTSALVCRPPPPSADATPTSSSSSTSFQLPPSLSSGKKAPKESGTIASVFATLSGGSLSDSLPERFGTLKRSLVTSEAHAKALHKAWIEVCSNLEKETEEVIRHGADLIPVVEYPGDKANGVNSIHDWLDEKSIEAIKKRGTVIVRGVVPQEEALDYKQAVRDYVAANPQTKGASLFHLIK